MSVVFTLMARVGDWSEWQRANAELLAGARAAGARRYWVLRNLNDAGEALLLAELPDYDAAQELNRAVSSRLSGLDGRIWESCGWEAIEGPSPEAGKREIFTGRR